MDELDLTDSLLINLVLQDPRAISIVEKIPEDQRNTVIEKLIILGDMVATHANISTSKETVENFFNPLRQDIERISEALNKIVPTISTPSLKGDITVQAIYESLKEHFMDDEFEDVSSDQKSSDVIAKVNGVTPVLIELKEYTSRVPSKEVDKFWRDMEVHNANHGIFISMRTGIVGCATCISMKSHMNRTGIFVVNNELNWKGHLFAFYVVKKLIESEGVKQKDVSKSQYEYKIKKIYRLVSEIQELTQDIESIRVTADSLKSHTATQTDKIVSTLTTYKMHLNEKIDQILEDEETINELANLKNG